MPSCAVALYDVEGAPALHDSAGAIPPHFGKKENMLSHMLLSQGGFGNMMSGIDKSLRSRCQS